MRALLISLTLMAAGAALPVIYLDPGSCLSIRLQEKELDRIGKQQSELAKKMADLKQTADSLQKTRETLQVRHDKDVTAVFMRAHASQELYSLDADHNRLLPR